MKFYTTFQIAKLIGVYPATIRNWINAGKLKAFQTIGKHRRVLKADLLKFLKKNNIPVNL